MLDNTESPTPTPERTHYNKQYDMASLYKRYLGEPVLEAQVINGIAQNKLSYTEVEYSLSQDERFYKRLEALRAADPTKALETLYASTFNRPLDDGGRQTYTDQLRAGRSIRDIANNIRRSNEGNNRFLTQLYAEVLERNIDDNGRQTYMAQLKAGKPFADIARKIRESEEARNIKTRHPDKYKFSGVPFMQGQLQELLLSSQSETSIPQAEVDRRIHDAVEVERGYWNKEVIEARVQAQKLRQANARLTEEKTHLLTTDQVATKVKEAVTAEAAKHNYLIVRLEGDQKSPDEATVNQRLGEVNNELKAIAAPKNDQDKLKQKGLLLRRALLEKRKAEIQRELKEQKSRISGIGFSEDANPTNRDYMEDSHIIVNDYGGKGNQTFVGIYDGHGLSDSSRQGVITGKEIADFVRNNLHVNILNWLQPGTDIKTAIRLGYLRTDGQIAQAVHDGKLSLDCGATAATAFCKGDKLYTANIGDARIVLNREGKAMRLSKDHKPNDPVERDRILVNGGSIVADSRPPNVLRVNDKLAVARTFGDFYLKPPRVSKEILSSEPEITETDITDKDKFVIIGCDGLFDVITDQEAIEMIAGETDPQIAADKLKNEALKRGSRDNISVMVINFNMK